MIPRMINPMSAAVFAVVKIFCTSLPKFNPRVFMNVSNAIMAKPSNCAVESETA